MAAFTPRVPGGVMAAFASGLPGGVMAAFASGVMAAFASGVPGVVVECGTRFGVVRRACGVLVRACAHACVHPCAMPGDYGDEECAGLHTRPSPGKART